MCSVPLVLIHAHPSALTVFCFPLKCYFLKLPPCVAATTRRPDTFTYYLRRYRWCRPFAFGDAVKEGSASRSRSPFRNLERAQLLRVTPKFLPRPTRSRSKSNSLTFGNESAVLIDGSERQCQVSNVRHEFDAVEQGPWANAPFLSASLHPVCQSPLRSRSSRSLPCTEIIA